MKSLFLVAVAVASFSSSEQTPGQDGCGPSVFCGSLGDNGYCNNPAHCGSAKLWYHDATSGKCQPLIYYGHGGNLNRFYSKEQCKKTCIDESKSPKLCKKCPKPVDIHVQFGIDNLSEKGFFCDGDDCQCGTGEKCCPVVYKVNYTRTLKGYACLPTVEGKCEEPYNGCSKHRRGGHGHSLRVFYV